MVPGLYPAPYQAPQQPPTTTIQLLRQISRANYTPVVSGNKGRMRTRNVSRCREPATTCRRIFHNLDVRGDSPSQLDDRHVKTQLMSYAAG
ncbi:hypothetical protein Tco_1018609 [Tanacetum coccineum]|uniref:Uncharacterized protein n=1 Tax=Tanacetum coccineum TaxID=301880 RepID=A0ABQ5FVX3_9ASTR